MTSTATRPSQFTIACNPCRVAKRRCDREKPQCSSCKKCSKECVFQTAPRSRKRKYWDESYVRALEEQVHSLLGLLADDDHREDKRPVEQDTVSLLSNDSQTEHIKQDDKHLHELLFTATNSTMRNSLAQPDAAVVRSQVAMEELGVMMWRTNMGDGVTIIDDLSIGPRDHHPYAKSVEMIPGEVGLLDQMRAFMHDRKLLCYLADLFLENINPDHQFIKSRSNEFLIGFPYQSYELVFLHSAILATGATFSDREDAGLIGDSFAEYAESLAFTCCRRSPSLAVVQGLCILSWRSLALGRDQFGWMYISMAAGIAVHLRLHVLALDETTTLQASSEDIQTFWMFFIIDRTAISILGRNCALSWRRVNVPDFETSFCSPTADLAQISFAWQCKLWYLHDQYMDQIYAPVFEDLSVSRKLRLLLTTYEKLNNFFKSRDSRLDLPSTSPSKPTLLFHMAYQMALLLTMPPFLRWITVCKSEEIVDLGVSNLVLRTLTEAASTMTRLIRTSLDVQGFDHANPVIIHHLLSASVVHLMNATSSNASLKKQSTRLLRSSMYFLNRLKKFWPTRAEKSLQVIKALAFRWHVVGALPLEFCHPITPTNNISRSNIPGDEEHRVHINGSLSSFDTELSQPWFDKLPMLSEQDMVSWGTCVDSNDFPGETEPANGFPDQDLMSNMENPYNHDELIPDTIDMSSLEVFGGLVHAENFNWLFGW